MSSLQLYPPWWIAQNAEKLEGQQAGQAAMLPPADVMASRIEAVQAFDRRDDLARISTPTLVVCARDDSQTPLYFSEYLASHIPGARLAVMEGGAHVCRSEAHTSELQSLMRISYAVFCLKKKNNGA